MDTLILFAAVIGAVWTPHLISTAKQRARYYMRSRGARYQREPGTVTRVTVSGRK